jgi:hypothetical protein
MYSLLSIDSMNSFTLVAISKVLHFAVLWIVFYFSEKIVLDAFINNVYVDGVDPPDVAKMFVYVFIFDFLLLIPILFGIYMAIASGPKDIPGGKNVMTNVTLDLFISWNVAFLVCVAIAYVSESQTCRYKDDGLRGIRAVFQINFYVAALLLLPPYYLMR